MASKKKSSDSSMVVIYGYNGYNGKCDDRCPFCKRKCRADSTGLGHVSLHHCKKGHAWGTEDQLKRTPWIQIKGKR